MPDKRYGDYVKKSTMKKLSCKIKHVDPHAVERRRDLLYCQCFWCGAIWTKEAEEPKNGGG